MLRLHGFPISNYYNMAKLSLLEKGVEFEEVLAQPSQEAAFKANAPMGKIPFLETPDGVLSESAAILEYLEETQPSPALYPVDPFARAKVREINRVLELYIELPARRHFPHVFFGQDKSQAAVDEVRPVMENALGALRQLGSFKPFIAGSEFSYADIVAHNTLGYATMVAKAIYDWDIIAEVPGLAEAMAETNKRPTTQQVVAAQQEALKAMQG